MNTKLTLPVDSSERKQYPLLSGCLKYFPAALAGIAKISKVGNDKHNPGLPLHHARGLSMDHGDCVVRHLLDTEDLLAALARANGDNVPALQAQILVEASQMAWRALAYSQMLHETFGAPLAPGAAPAADRDKAEIFEAVADEQAKLSVDEMMVDLEKRYDSHSKAEDLKWAEFDKDATEAFDAGIPMATAVDYATARMAIKQKKQAGATSVVAQDANEMSVALDAHLKKGFKL
jgi:hypothetical protein